MEIPTREDFGMVWMGDMLLQNESHDIMMDHAVDSPCFSDPNTQSIAEDEILCRNQMGMEGFMMLEDLDDSSRWYVNGMSEEMFLDSDAANAAKVVTTSTQTGLQNAPPGSRKIKPVKHPGLKLQTPIAYQRDTDLNVIPIQKDGRAVCKKCGAIGVKHAFYTRERRYCSLACARGSGDSDINNQEIDSSPNTQWPEEMLTQQQSLSESQQALYLGINCNEQQYLMHQQSLVDSQLPPVFILQPDEPPLHKQLSSSDLTYDWILQLTDPFFTAAPTSCFKHAPMADLWHYIDVGLKVEVENTDSDDFCEEFPNSFWIASVMRVEGYKALLRYEGFIEDGSKDFWVNLCSSSVHPVGWCAVRGKPLIPPKTIKDKYDNWKEFLKRRLTGARTLPSNFYSKVNDSLKSRFRCDLTVEVVDKQRISQVKVATIDKITGKRLELRYYDSKPNIIDLFWCHEDSPLIHPVGWAHRIGQKLDSSPEYYDRMMKGLREKDDSTADLFITPERCPLPANCFFREGMKIEAIDPLHLNDICVATVMQVLNDGYLMISIDLYNDQNPSPESWFCYHMTSPCIFPAGFCVANNLSLTPPKDYNRDTFEWNHYIQETGCVVAPTHFFNQETPDHGFQVGMKLESADLMEPNLVCVATISHVVGRLLKIHFDGWGTDCDQWLDCDSCDIYPVGWCELVGHKLETPRAEIKPVINESRSRKKRGKGRHSASQELPYKSVMQTSDDKMIPFSDVKDSLFNVSVPDNNAVNFMIDNSHNVVPNVKNSNLEEWNGSSFITNSYDSNETVPGMCDNEDVMISEIKKAPQACLSEKADNPDDLNYATVSDSSVPACTPVQQPPEALILTEQNNKFVSDKPKVIPRLSEYRARGSSSTVMPETWDVNDVAEFLKINDCSTYCDAFIKQGINGRKLLELTKEEVHALVGMKVGPSLKIQNLITQLTSKIYPTHSRHNKTKNIL